MGIVVVWFVCNHKHLLDLFFASVGALKRELYARMSKRFWYLDGLSIMEYIKYFPCSIDKLYILIRTLLGKAIILLQYGWCQKDTHPLTLSLTPSSNTPPACCYLIDSVSRTKDLSAQNGTKRKTKSWTMLSSLALTSIRRVSRLVATHSGRAAAPNVIVHTNASRSAPRFFSNGPFAVDAPDGEHDLQDIVSCLYSIMYLACTRPKDFLTNKTCLLGTPHRKNHQHGPNEWLMWRP